VDLCGKLAVLWIYSAECGKMPKEECAEDCLQDEVRDVQRAQDRHRLRMGRKRGRLLWIQVMHALHE
jgi:hypothetical protein